MQNELDNYIETFLKLELNKVIDFEKFNRIAIVHHSCAIEGSSLTLEETALLITQGITAKGKPMSEHQMVNDHYGALLFCLDAASKKNRFEISFLKQINSLVNKNTGQIRNLALGICDDTKGDFRLGNVRAGTAYFVNYDKVKSLTENLCVELAGRINEVKTNEEIYNLSFDAHFNLVSIHPWFDGNGRTSRLVMNYIQAYHNKPLSIVFIEDKPAYIKALNDAREKDDITIFRKFMFDQLFKYIEAEAEKFRKGSSGFTFMF
ncbi:MAG: Fic family protein [Bacteroidia bacterium]